MKNSELKIKISGFEIAEICILNLNPNYITSFADKGCRLPPIKESESAKTTNITRRTSKNILWKYVAFLTL